MTIYLIGYSISLLLFWHSFEPEDRKEIPLKETLKFAFRALILWPVYIISELILFARGEG